MNNQWTKDTVHIIGAGLAGLLAANMLKAMKFHVHVHEAKSELPNNHSAVLRFRTPLVGDVLGIPFKKVNMIKASVPWDNYIADNLAYSRKVTGMYLSDRSIPENAIREERYIAPSNLIKRMAEGLDITFNQVYLPGDDLRGCPVILTAPMSGTMDYTGKKGLHPLFDLDFKYIGGDNLRCHLESTDAYVSLYIPSPDEPFSRVSITGNELIAEMPHGPYHPNSDNPKKYSTIDPKRLIERCFELLGMDNPGFNEVKLKSQPYAKIMPVNDDQRKQYMHWLTDTYNIYSLGRFATWRPGLLLDDLVKDVRLISKWISQGRYEMVKAR